MTNIVVLRKTKVESFGEGEVLEAKCPDCGTYNMVDSVISIPEECYNCGRKMSALKMELISKNVKCRALHHKLRRNNTNG